MVPQYHKGIGVYPRSGVIAPGSRSVARSLRLQDLAHHRRRPQHRPNHRVPRPPVHLAALDEYRCADDPDDRAPQRLGAVDHPTAVLRRGRTATPRDERSRQLRLRRSTLRDATNRPDGPRLTGKLRCHTLPVADRAFRRGRTGALPSSRHDCGSSTSPATLCARISTRRRPRRQGRRRLTAYDAAA